MRDKEPYLRDALVRAGYRTPFTRADWDALFRASLIEQAVATVRHTRAVRAAQRSLDWTNHDAARVCTAVHWPWALAWASSSMRSSSS